MKAITLLGLLVACHCSFGQIDTNVIAIGDWSAPVTITNTALAISRLPLRYRSLLRGRLLVYDAEENEGDGWPPGRIYLELQNLQKGGGLPLEFYFDSDKSCLHFEMHDGHDKPIPLGMNPYVGPLPKPFTITLPPDSTVRVRADFDVIGRGSPKPDGLQLFISGMRCWTIRPDSANDYYLSATFSPPANHQDERNFYVWQGTLQLPRVKIPVQRIRKQ